MRKVLVALFFGLFLGGVYSPFMDSVALYRTYGVDTGVVFNEMECLAIGMGIAPEIGMAKALGVSKRQYMNYFEDATKSAAVDPASRARLGMITFYVDRIWHSTDGGGAVIDGCFKRAADAAVPKVKV